jgi:hypothetical protein
MIGAKQIGVYSISELPPPPRRAGRPAHTHCARLSKPFKSRPVTGNSPLRLCAVVRDFHVHCRCCFSFLTDERRRLLGAAVQEISLLVLPTARPVSPPAPACNHVISHAICLVLRVSAARECISHPHEARRVVPVLRGLRNRRLAGHGHAPPCCASPAFAFLDVSRASLRRFSRFFVVFASLQCVCGATLTAGSRRSRACPESSREYVFLGVSMDFPLIITRFRL